MSQRQLELPIREKLTRILASKSARCGEFAIPFSPDNFPLDLRSANTDFNRFALEIGCGWGEFTRAWAKNNPDTLVVAVEKKLARVLASSREQKSNAINNIRYLVLDIAWFFDGIFAGEQFDEITVNFPDPWPKARHHKHRFVSPNFVEEIARIAKANARFTFASDNYLYAREVAQVFEPSSQWKNIVAPYAARSEVKGRPQSFFEHVHRNEGALIYFLAYERQ